MQAATVESTQNREWVRLIGRDHDLQHWRTPDERTEVQILDRDYVPGELEDHENWIIPIFEPVRLTYLVQPFELQISYIPLGRDESSLHPNFFIKFVTL